MPAPIIAALLGRLLASRVGVGAIQAASKMKGFGGFAKAAMPQAGAEAGQSGGGILQRMASAVTSRGSALFGRKPATAAAQPAQAIPTVKPMQPPVQPTSFAQTVAQNKGSFGNILSGRMSMHQATQAGQPVDGGGDNVRQQQSDQAKSLAGKMNPGSALLSGLKGASLAGGLLATTFVSLVGIGKKLADSQVEQLRHLRAFNGAIAASYGRMTRGEILRTRQQAAATSGSTAALVDAVNEMRDAWAPVQNIMTNLMNTVGWGAAKIVAMIGRGLSVLDYIGRMVGFIADKPATAGPWQTTLNDLAKGYRGRNAPPPKGGGKK